MNCYFGRYAELYDLFYRDKSYDKEAKFINFCLNKFGLQDTKHILELACGTGEHSFELEKFNYDIIATDFSTDMLKHARSKALKINSKVDFRYADMRKIDFKEDVFDAVICMFDSVGYILKNEELTNMFSGVNKHLNPNGLFMFEFIYSDTMIKYYDPLRVRRFSKDDGEILRISETSIDKNLSLADIKYTIYDLKSDGIYSKIVETHTIRYFEIDELSHLLINTGFTPIKWFSGFTENENISKDTWHILVLAIKENDTI